MKNLLTPKNVLAGLNALIAFVSFIAFLKADAGYWLLLVVIVTGINALYISGTLCAMMGKKCEGGACPKE